MLMCLPKQVDCELGHRDQPKQLARHLRDLWHSSSPCAERRHPVQVAQAAAGHLLPTAARCRLAMPVVGCSCICPLLSTGPVSSRAAKSLPIQSCLQRHEVSKSRSRQRCQHRHGVVTISSMHRSDGRAPRNRGSRHSSAGWQPLAELHGRTLAGTSLAIAVPALWSLGGGGNLGGTGGSGGGGGGSGGSGPGASSLWDYLHCCNACRPPAHRWLDFVKLHVLGWWRSTCMASISGK